MVVVALRSTGIGVREIVSIRLPRTSTLVGSDSDVPRPSNTRTLLNSVVGPLACWAWAGMVEKMSAQTGVADNSRRKCIETIQLSLFVRATIDVERRDVDPGGFQRLTHPARDVDGARRIAVNAHGVGAHLDHLAGDRYHRAV